jgi:hypothetical protein
LSETVPVLVPVLSPQSIAGFWIRPALPQLTVSTTPLNCSPSVALIAAA